MPKIALGTNILSDLEKGSLAEWITTNGLGGFASSSSLGCNTRRYHGLLVASRPGDPDRMVILSKLEETIKIGHKYYYLSTNKFTDNYVHPHGYTHLRKFEQAPFPRFIFTVKDVTIIKEIFMIRGTNTTVIRYKIFTGSNKFTFIVHPLVSFRNFHKIGKENRNFSTATRYEDETLKMQPYPDLPILQLQVRGMEYKDLKNWFKNFQYDVEKERGLDFVEDLFNPGYFFTPEISELSVDFIASIDDEIPCNIDLEYQKSIERVEHLFKIAGATEDTDEKSLVLAADMHVVSASLKNKEKRTTIVAGYHWFGDWGRDTFISLPGLTLATGRYDEAREILRTFASACRKSLIPNRFGDLGDEPIYNTVDASLWFINAINEYLKATGDLEFVRECLYETCKSIISGYENGTDFGIKMDIDGLISAGELGVQVTWMDAKIGDWVVTPRHGKPVEINALWFNDLSWMSELARSLDDIEYGNHCSQLAEKAWESFNKKFWFEREGYLYDNLEIEGPDASLRPNQLYAISLPYPVLQKERWKPVVAKVHERLYTPFGLRSLDYQDPRYRGIYRGEISDRDGAYHMGTSWGFLLGPFMEAYLKAEDFSTEAVRKVSIMMNLWMGHLLVAGLNTLSEIFDGDEPFTPRGCISQAWSVAEALRIKQILKRCINKDRALFC